MGDLRAAPVVGPSGRGSAPPSRPNDLNSTTKITHSIFFYPSVSTFTSAASALNTESSCKNPLYIYAEMAAKNARGMSVLPRRGLFERQKNFTAINTTTVKQSIKVVTPNFA